MNAAAWIAPALLVIVLLGSARVWQQQRRNPARSTRRTAALLVLQIGAAGLLYATLLPPPVHITAQRLTVLTGHADTAGRAATADASVIALPEARPHRGSAFAPDLATALRQHPGTLQLQLVGDGLSARDRDLALPAQVTLLAAAAPRGWIALQPPPITVPGAVFSVRARAQGVADASAELLDPAGIVVDRAPLGSDGSSVLQGVARASGRSEFSLRLVDAAKHVVDTVPVPVQTGDAPAVQVLVVAGAPTPELKYLRRWATDTGLALQAQASAGAGVSLGDAPVALTPARLAATDVLILDERSIAALGPAQRSAVQQALRNGLGVLVRSSGPVGDGARQTLRGWGLDIGGSNQSMALRLPADPDDALLQARRGPQRAATPSTAYIDDADNASHNAALPTLEQFALRTGDATALLRDAGGAPVGGWRDVGRGRLALLPVTDSYRLVLAGRDDRHAELWSGVLATVARPLPAAPSLRMDTATAWAGERIALCALDDRATVRDPEGATVALRVDPATGHDRCAGYWPQQPGWHHLQQGKMLQAFYVFDPARAQPLHRQQVREATARRLSTAGSGGSETTHPLPGPRWPWLLGLVLVAGLLWWLERRRVPAVAG
ncbi:hypothetical protein KQ945_10265 [Bacillus subtilis subsp. subtilis]|nr:hypothetical protein [Bacillus subtilis subsp. subtilis]